MNFTKKERVVIIIVVCFIALLSFFKIFDLNTKNDDNIAGEELDYNKELMEDGEKINDTEEPETAELSKIIIHIAGSVVKPGILELEQGSRVIDAVELSGGLTKDANIDSINLARKLNDEEKIYIPREGEEIKEELVRNSEASTDQISSGTIDINTCTKEELMTLPGIGDKTADKILNYREENIFKSIEDIKKVSGIGDKKFEAIKDLIKVN